MKAKISSLLSQVVAPRCWLFSEIEGAIQVWQFGPKSLDGSFHFLSVYSVSVEDSKKIGEW